LETGLMEGGTLRRSRFTKEQINRALRVAEACAKTAHLGRKHGISDAARQNWMAKYGGLKVSVAKKLRALGDQSGRLNPLLADAMLGNAGLKELLSKNNNYRCTA